MILPQSLSEIPDLSPSAATDRDGATSNFEISWNRVIL